MHAPTGIDFSVLPTLERSRAASLVLIDELSARLTAALGQASAVVAAAGSLGRLEATSGSDFDGIVVTMDDAKDDPTERVYAALAGSPLALPKPDVARLRRGQVVMNSRRIA